MLAITWKNIEILKYCCADEIDEVGESMATPLMLAVDSHFNEAIPYLLNNLCKFDTAE